VKQGRHWIWIVVALLSGNALAVAALAVIATGDPSHHVIEDYYQKALAWDEKMAQDRENHQLGWRIGLELAPRPGGDMLVQARLIDRRGRPLSGARLELAAFHKARARWVLRSRLEEDRAGSYRAVLPIRRAGIWAFEFEVTHQGQRFTQTLEQELAAPARHARARSRQGAGRGR
jgi:hypothetical protein